MRELESISQQTAQGFTKFDVFLSRILRGGNIWCKNRVAELIELVECYLESQ